MSVNNSTNNEQLLSPKEAAKYLGGIVTVETLAKWRCTKQEDIPYVKIGSKVSYEKKELDAYISRKKSNA